MFDTIQQNLPTMFWYCLYVFIREIAIKIFGLPHFVYCLTMFLVAIVFCCFFILFWMDHSLIVVDDYLYLFGIYDIKFYSAYMLQFLLSNNRNICFKLKINHSKKNTPVFDMKKREKKQKWFHMWRIFERNEWLLWLLPSSAELILSLDLLSLTFWSASFSLIRPSSKSPAILAASATCFRPPALWL